MIKAWNRGHDQYFNSFHLEAMVRAVFQYQTISDYPSAELRFFEGAYEQIDLYDPAGLGGNLGQYLSTELAFRTMLNLNFRASTQNAREAIAFNISGNNQQAIAKWRDVFGAYFPAFG